jgi:dolichol-phosphate mannosyltransferase
MASRSPSQPALVSVVVPVYFNAPSLPELVRRLGIVARGLAPAEFEFVFVDDGSGDASFDVLAELGRSDRRVRVLRLSRNFGSNAALLAGITYARGDCVVMLAADLQDPPELIPEMVDAWERGAEVVLAARRRRADPLITRVFAAGFNRLFRRFVFPDWPEGGCDFMLVSRRVRTILTQLCERNSYIFGQAMWAGFRRHVIYYDRVEREYGRSRWTKLKKIKYFIDAFTAFSYLPVRMASLLGFALAGAGFIYAAAVVIARLANLIQEPGFAALMVVVLLAAGAQLVVIGLIGEYLWRVLEESRRRPAFLIADTLNMRHARADLPAWATLDGVSGDRAEPLSAVELAASANGAFPVGRRERPVEEIAGA